MLKKAFISSLPVLTGYLALGSGFGLLLRSSGFEVYWAIIISIVVYAGSMQFVLVDLLMTMASPITTIFTTVMVNARHVFYGISLIDKYKNAGKFKPYMMFSLTDETYSLVCNSKLPEGKQASRYYFFVSLLNHIYWIGGSAIGAVVGSYLTIDTTGIDFALTALFITIFIDQWKSTKQHLPALLGLGLSILALLIFGAQTFLIPSMILIVTTLFLLRRRIKDGV